MKTEGLRELAWQVSRRNVNWRLDATGVELCNAIEEARALAKACLTLVPACEQLVHHCPVCSGKGECDVPDFAKVANTKEFGPLPGIKTVPCRVCAGIREALGETAGAPKESS